MAHITGTSGDDSLPGTTAGDLIEGFAGNDTLAGGDGNDTLKGGAGDDSMTGGDGNDVYYVGNAGDHVVETSAAAAGGTDRVYSSLANYTLGANVEYLRLMSAGAANGTGNALDNLIFAGDGNNIMTGGGGSDTVSYLYASGAVTVSLAIAGDQATGSSGMDRLIGIENLNGGNFGDTLTGNGQDNVLNGGLGQDTLSGGNGDDVYYVNNMADVIVETMANKSIGGVDLVYSSAAGYVLSANVENLRITAAGAANATGNGLANTIFAGAGDNVMNGRAGNDTLSFAYAGAAVDVSLGDPNSQATGGSGSDTVRNFENLSGSQYNDTLEGTGESNTLTGGGGNDSLLGNAGNDYLDGGAGADTMNGSYDVDFYVVNSAGDTIEGESSVYSWGDTVRSTLSAYTLGVGLEFLVIASPGTASGTGNSAENRIYAGTGDNLIDGGDGWDTVDYSQGAVGGVTVDLTGGTATGGSGNDTLLSIENATGSAYDDALGGTTASNTLDGGAGADTMNGGAGSDTYHVDDAGDEIIDSGGYETVFASLASYTMEDFIESVVIDTAGAADVTGNANGNTIFAGAGDNVIDGGGGVNSLSYSYATAGVTVSLAITTAQATGGSGSDTVSNFTNLFGSWYDDNLSGDANANQLSGGTGPGEDTLAGHGGNDIYYVFNSTDVVSENADDGIDSVYSTEDFTLPDHVENAFVHTTSGTHLVGNGLDNYMAGGSGSDTLDGGGGADTFVFASDLSGVDNVDTIMVFATGTDTLSLENSYFGKLGAGALGDANFHVGAAAAAADDYIVYNSTTGALYYDVDGNGAGAQVQFAILSGGPTLAATDFIVT